MSRFGREPDDGGEQLRRLAFKSVARAEYLLDDIVFQKTTQISQIEITGKINNPIFVLHRAAQHSPEKTFMRFCTLTSQFLTR